jgi:hypothetical protein
MIRNSKYSKYFKNRCMMDEIPLAQVEMIIRRLKKLEIDTGKDFHVSRVQRDEDSITVEFTCNVVFIK